MLIVSSAATAFGGVMTKKALRGCEAVSYRLTSLVITLAFVCVTAFALTKTSIGEMIMKGDAPTKMTCTNAKSMQYALLASAAFTLSGFLYLGALKSNSKTTSASAIIAPVTLVFTAFLSIAMGEANLTFNMCLGVTLSLLTVAVLNNTGGSKN